MFRKHYLTGLALMAAALAWSSTAAWAAPYDFNGSADNATDAFGYYYAVTGGKFPTGNTPNGDNASGGTFRFINDEPAWTYPVNVWNKDDWFPSNAGLALTLRNGGAAVYDNNGIEDGTHGDYYNAQAQGNASKDTPGLYRGYSMTNNWDWIYATYFRLEQDTVIDTIIGYFDANAGFDPDNPRIDYLMNIWGAVLESTSASSYMPTSASFIGDMFSSISAAGAFTTSDSGVDRVFDDGATDDILRLTYVLDTPVTLAAGDYFFSHSAVILPVPEPATLTLFAIGLVGLAGFGRMHRRDTGS